jgi:hypothetical protein
MIVRDDKIEKNEKDGHVAGLGERRGIHGVS